MRQFVFLPLVITMIGCQSKPMDKPISIFGNVFRIDSVAGRQGFSDPFFIVLTKDSLFSAYGYWDYSFPLETEIRINNELEIVQPNGKWIIEVEGDRFWLDMDSIRLRYAIAPGDFDTVYKNLRVMKTQEALLLGQWELQRNNTEADDMLRCEFGDKNLLQFVRTKSNYKMAQLITVGKNGTDTCLQRSFRLNGSDLMINDYDTWPPYKIIKLDNETLILQDWRRLLYFKKVIY